MQDKKQNNIFVVSVPKYDWKKIAEEKNRREGSVPSEEEVKALGQCGGRDCDQCEIGGCDHGIEVR